MLRTLQLLLPVLVPSWRFFDGIAPSPRIEISSDDENWQEVRKRPAHVPIGQIFIRLFHNGHWNDTLFLVSLSERLLEGDATRSEAQIVDLIRRDDPDLTGPFRFRLSLVSREGQTVVRHFAYTSPIHEP